MNELKKLKINKLMKMSNEKPKKPRLKGFAKFAGTIIDSVKGTQEFKDIILGIKTRVLLSNAEDKWAALISIVNDTITVEGIKKDPKFNIKKMGKRLSAWAWWEFPNLEYMMSASTWSAAKWIKKMAGNQTRGASQIARIGQILRLARSSEKTE